MKKGCGPAQPGLWRSVCLLLILAVPPVAAAPPEAAQAAARQSRVALVTALSGAVEIGTGGRRALRLLDWLPARARLTAGPNATLVLAFRSGRCFEMAGPGTADVTEDGLRPVSARVRSLPRLPAWPLVAPIRADEHAGRRAAAVRVRAASLPGLTPAAGALVLEGAVTLGFDALPGLATYDVEVQASDGSPVFTTSTSQARVAVPATALRPGAVYHWSVSASGAGRVARGESFFRTLEAATVAAREPLVNAARGAPRDLSALLFLAAFDLETGLIEEVERSFATAREHDQAGARQLVLAEIERRWGARGGP